MPPSPIHSVHPRRFMEVNGSPLPHSHQAVTATVNKPSSLPKRHWRVGWILLITIVVVLGTVFILHLGGRIGNDKSSSGNVGSTNTTNGTSNDDTDNNDNDSTSAPSSMMTPMTKEPSLPNPPPPPSFTVNDPSSTIPPTARPLHPLEYVGWCSSNTPCFACQGQCFADTDCAPGHACFWRVGFASIPNCSGAGIFGVNYCILPTMPILEDKGDYGCSPQEQCGLCQGNNECQSMVIVCIVIW